MHCMHDSDVIVHLPPPPTPPSGVVTLFLGGILVGYFFSLHKTKFYVLIKSIIEFKKIIKLIY